MRLRSPEILWSVTRFLHEKGWHTLARIVKMLNWLIHKCLLPSEARVGKNVILEHYALGVVLHPQVTIGNNCRIYHEVCLAAESDIGSEHRIIVGDDVVIGTHAVIIARKNSSLHIGDRSVIGAGAVVVGDVPADEVWAGNPARKIKDRISQ